MKPYKYQRKKGKKNMFNLEKEMKEVVKDFVFLAKNSKNPNCADKKLVAECHREATKKKEERKKK